MNRTSAPSSAAIAAPAAPEALPALVLALLLALPAPAGAAWTGRVETREGVPHVLNPTVPAEGSSEVRLEEAWRAGGSEDEEEFFGVIAAVAADPKGTTYALDRQLNEIKVYDASGAFLRTIGHEGEGPGEFRGPGDLFFTADGNLCVGQSMPGKFVLLTPDGQPAGDRPLPEVPGGGIRFLINAAGGGDRIYAQLVESIRGEGKITQATSLIAIDPSGKEVGRFFEGRSDLDFANLVVDERKTQRIGWTAGPDGRVYVVPESFGPYAIQVYGPDGKLVRVIEREYEHRRRSADEMKSMEGRIILRGLPNPKMVVSEFDRDVRQMFPRGDGSLWVLTSRGGRDLPAGVLGVFDVFDPEGRFVRQVTLRGEGDPEDDAFHMAGDRFYVVRRFSQGMTAFASRGGNEEEADDGDDAEPMELICYRVPAVP